MEPQPQFRCECGFPCYTVDQAVYHRDGTCLAMRRLLGVIAARQRLGHRDHRGIRVNGLLLLFAESKKSA